MLAQQLGAGNSLKQEKNRMNIFAELRPQIQEFKNTREHVVSCATLPPTDKDMNFGKAPYAIDDGDHYYAVIDEDGNSSPLPFGYQISDDEIDMDGVDAILSKPMASASNGMSSVRYVPLVEGFKVPGDRVYAVSTYGTDIYGR